MGTSRTTSIKRERRRRDPGYRPDARWHAAAGLMYRREDAASCPSFSWPHRSAADRWRPPFFGPFHALAVDDGGARTGLSLLAFATFLIERVVDTIQGAVVSPQIEVVVDRALRRQVFRDRAPLTAGG